MFATAQVTKATITNSNLWSMRRQRSTSHSATTSAASRYGQKMITHWGMRTTGSGLREGAGDEEYGARAHDALPVFRDVAVAEGDKIRRRRGGERHGIAERDVGQRGEDAAVDGAALVAVLALGAQGDSQRGA